MHNYVIAIYPCAKFGYNMFSVVFPACVKYYDNVVLSLSCARAQLKPQDGFSRLTAQMTRFHAFPFERLNYEI